MVKTTLVECLDETEDPRRGSNGTLHDITEILMVVVCAMLFNVETVEDFAQWAQVKGAWLRRFLVFRNGVSSHTAFNQLYGILGFKQFETLCKLHRMGTSDTFKGSPNKKRKHPVCNDDMRVTMLELKPL